MKHTLNETHDPALTSWVDSSSGTEFPIQNLPLGVFERPGGASRFRVGAAIGDWILDLAECAGRGLLHDLGDPLADACRSHSLNGLMELAPDSWSALRRRLSLLLRAGKGERPKDRGQVEASLLPRAGTVMRLPALIGDYTDFYASIHHARNVGSMFRPDNPLLPNYKHLPVGYHGRASSIVVSGTPIVRPCGQLEQAGLPPDYAPSRMLDYELELGMFAGLGNRLGDPVRISDAESYLFGLCLVNDWSARDIQKWEYQPLGPFLGKSFATTISPWVVSMEALAPFRTPAFPRPASDPKPLPYLSDPEDRERGGIDLTLEVFLRSERMRAGGIEPVRLSRGNFRDMYWTAAQLLAHHTSNGCNLRPGDLLASGTVSGVERDSRGCLLELTWRGTEPVELPGGETRRFLEDGDEVLFRARAERSGFTPIGFGECRGVILPNQAARAASLDLE